MKGIVDINNNPLQLGDEVYVALSYGYHLKRGVIIRETPEMIEIEYEKSSGQDKYKSLVTKFYSKWAISKI